MDDPSNADSPNWPACSPLIQYVRVRARGHTHTHTHTHTRKTHHDVVITRDTDAVLARTPSVFDPSLATIYRHSFVWINLSWPPPPLIQSHARWVGVNLPLCLRQRNLPALLMQSSQFERLFSTGTRVTQCPSRPSWLHRTSIYGALVPSIQRMAFPSLVVTCKFLGLSPRDVEATGLGMLRQSDLRTGSECTYTHRPPAPHVTIFNCCRLLDRGLFVVLACIVRGLNVTFTVVCIDCLLNCTPSSTLKHSVPSSDPHRPATRASVPHLQPGVPFTPSWCNLLQPPWCNTPQVTFKKLKDNCVRTSPKAWCNALP